MAGPAKNQSQFIYVGVFEGKFVIRCKEDDPDPDKRSRKNKLGEVIWEIPYGKLEDMMLADIREASHDQYGKSWEIIMEAGNDYYLLRLGKRSRLSSMFLSRLENIQLNKPFTLTSWYTDDEKNVITIWQDGEKVERAHSRENPNGLPEAKQTTVNGELVWDFSDQIKFYSGVVESLRPHMQGVDHDMQQVAQEQSKPAPKTKKKGPAKQQPATQGNLYEDEDDLPF